MRTTRTETVAPDRALLETLELAALSAIVALAAVLRFANLAALGYANHYYSAAVKSMLQSWHNLFFLAAEPGGSVSVDKPPVGLWLQACSAFFLGVNGLGLLLPQILAGVGSVVVVYRLVRRWFGAPAGLLAALALAVTPVAVATDRNNTMDSTLILTLLLAAWAFVKATESGRLRFLLLGAGLVGIAFNIKMLEAYLPLPAFYGLYFLGSTERLWRKAAKLGLATVLVLAVSLSWATAVDLTPASRRPYVGSSSNNSEMSLIVGYNGLARLLGERGSGIAPAGDSMRPPPTPGSTSDGNRLVGIGQPGALRLFKPPLSKEAGWLLPFGLCGVVLLALRARPRRPLAPKHQALVLWGGWLVTGVALFSSAGFFHEYYLSILAAPLAALAGITAAELWRLGREHRWPSVALLLVMASGTLALQVMTVRAYIGMAWWLRAAIALAFMGAVMLVAATGRRLRPGILAGFGCVIAGLLLAPAAWSGLTTLNPSPNQSLPRAYSGWTGEPAAPSGIQVDRALLAYLEPRTQDVAYLMAVPSSMQGADYVLATGRPVLYIGGFMGKDQVVDASQLAHMAAEGKLRYIYWDARGGAMSGQASLSAWITSHCARVQGFEAYTRDAGAPDGTGGATRPEMLLSLYEYRPASAMGRGGG